MRSSSDVVVRAPRSVVWKLVTDIEHSAGRVTGIETVEVLEKPEKGLVGLKWRETRTRFGRTTLEEVAGGTRLRREFAGAPRTFGAKVMSPIFGVLLRGTCGRPSRETWRTSRRGDPMNSRSRLRYSFAACHSSTTLPSGSWTQAKTP